jgi:hypothetical protein
MSEGGQGRFTYLRDGLNALALLHREHLEVVAEVNLMSQFRMPDPSPHKTSDGLDMLHLIF